MVKYITLVLFCTIFTAALCQADTNTTTTTTTNPDGSETVEQTTTEPTPPAETSQNKSGPKIIGPTGATGVIRRSDRRQDRRLEEDLDNLQDAIDSRPGIDRRNRR